MFICEGMTTCFAITENHKRWTPISLAKKTRNLENCFQHGKLFLKLYAIKRMRKSVGSRAQALEPKIT